MSDDEVASWSESDGVLWVDCDQNNSRARKWLAHDSNIDDSFRAILLAGETRPRSISDGNGLAIVMRGINMNPGALPDDMVAVRAFMNKSRIITSRRRRVLSIHDVQESLLSGHGPKTSGEFLVSLTNCLAGRIEAAVENVEQLLDKMDEQIASGDIATVRTELAVVRRQAAALRRHLAPQRDALDRLSRSTSGILSEKENFDLMQEGDHITRQIEDLDLARENALVTQEELMTRVAHEQNARMYLLSVVAAIFLPLTFVTGLLGMNVDGLPGTHSPFGFAISAAIMLLLGVGLVGYFRWRKWI